MSLISPIYQGNHYRPANKNAFRVLSRTRRKKEDQTSRLLKNVITEYIEAWNSRGGLQLIYWVGYLPQVGKEYVI